MKIRSHLLVLLGGAFLPLMIFAVAITSFSWWQQRNDLELRYLERVRAMTIALDTEVDGAIRMLRALGLSQTATDTRADLGERMRRTLDTQPLWSAVAVGDPEWKRVTSAWRESFTAPIPSLDPRTLQRVEATRLPSVSGLVRARDGQYETQIVVPVLRGRRIDSILVAVVQQSAWLKYMSQYPIGNGATMTLLDQDGTVIARTQDNGRWVGKHPPALLLEKSREMAEGAYRGTGADGVPVYAAHSRSVRWGWTVATSVPAVIIEAALLDSSALLAAAAFVSTSPGADDDALGFTSLDCSALSMRAPYAGCGVAWSMTRAAPSLVAPALAPATSSFAIALPANPTADATAAICIQCLGFMRCSFRFSGKGRASRPAAAPAGTAPRARESASYVVPLCEAACAHAAGRVRVAV